MKFVAKEGFSPVITNVYKNDEVKQIYCLNIGEPPSILKIFGNR